MGCPSEFDLGERLTRALVGLSFWTHTSEAAESGPLRCFYHKQGARYPVCRSVLARDGDRHGSARAEDSRRSACRRRWPVPLRGQVDDHLHVVPVVAHEQPQGPQPPLGYRGQYARGQDEKGRPRRNRPSLIHQSYCFLTINLKKRSTSLALQPSLLPGPPECARVNFPPLIVLVPPAGGQVSPSANVPSSRVST